MENFADWMLDTFNRGGFCLMASIGHRCGLFDAMDGMPPATSEEIAARAGLNERYVREWLGAMTASRVVECSADADVDRYRLPPEHAALLTRAAGADNLASLTQYIPLLGSVEDDIVACFKKGGGVPYERFPRFHAVMAEDSRQSVMSSLESHVLPLVPELRERLQSGIRALDVGCGSGLFSIAAHKLGATKVVGIDVNPRCIEISQANRNFLAPGAPIEFHVASALETARLEHFGSFDLVYAWGSLHHTGSMWNAVHNVSKCVAPQGSLILAIYNKHITSLVWKSIKWTYNQMPGIIQRGMVLMFAAIIYIAKLLVTRTNPLKKERGMDFWFDVIDWVGGYPYEYATLTEVVRIVTRGSGFQLRRSVPASVPTGCNEFVFDKK